MALDGATLCIIKNELNEKAVDCRIDRVTMPARDRVVIYLSKTGFSKRLLISCSPTSPRIHLTDERFENPAVPPMLCMLLRRRLGSGRLIGVRQAGLDRILFLDFLCKNELGDEVTLTICVEIMSRLSNMLLLSEGRIIDCIHRIDPEEGKRFVLPGAAYELPPEQQKLNLLESTAQSITQAIRQMAHPVCKAAVATIDGISPIIGRELEFVCCNGGSVNANELTDEQAQRLCGQLERLKNAIQTGGKPQIVYNENGIPRDFSFIDIIQYGSSASTRRFETIGELLDAFYAERDNAELKSRRSQGMSRLLTNLHERCEKKLHLRSKELRATEGRDRLREYGELIKANLHSIRPGDSFLQTVNYYDESCAEIRIPLDVALSASRNAQKYFRDYRKASTAAGMLGELITAAQDELRYIESVQDALSRAQTVAELAQIEAELCDSGYIRKKGGRREKPIKAAPAEYTSSDGFTVLVGKNNRQNDQLTLKTAAKTDIWLHTKNIPGSHTIIIADGKQVPDSTIREAAVLAAQNSKAAASKQVPVDYALVKYVKKPAGAKPGMVIYTNNKTIFVDPQERKNTI